jgi:DNA-binding transcriptional ArsR family regulator
MTTGSLSPGMLAAVAIRFKVLAEPARLQILHALMRGPLHVTGLIAATGLNQANLSKHLKLLHSQHFVSRRRDGLFVYYQLADDSVYALCDLMCGAVVEARRRRAAE